MAKLLLIDDEQEWLRSLRLTLSQAKVTEYNNIFTAENGEQAFNILQKEKIDLILLDLIMGCETGEEILQKIKKSKPSAKVVIMTGISSIQSAINCINMGASDYLIKTVQIEELVSSISKMINKILTKGNDEVELNEDFKEFVTVSPKMAAVFAHLKNVAQSPEPILITGESGVGKGVIAKAFAQFSRPDKPFIPLNVSGFDSQMFADALFGHVKGAFTNADMKRNGMIRQAGDGVLFLDEIGDLSPESQVKLLYLTQTKEYQPLGSDETIKSGARFIFATNQDIEKSDKFRKDLYYRIATHNVRIPPLRERPEDIPILAEYFMKEALKSLGKREEPIQDNIIQLMRSYDFPGNARELRAIIYDVVAKAGNEMPSTADFIQYFKQVEGENIKEKNAYIPKLDEAIENLINKAIKAADGNQTKAASIIGISQSAMNRRLKKYKKI